MNTALSEQEEERYQELQAMALDAARAGDLAQLEPMVEAGMSVDLEDAKGNSLLMLASYHGQEEVVTFLANAGADVERRNNRGQTPLAGVAFKGYLACARVLVLHGADPQSPQGHGQTPVTFAAMFGRTEVLKFLQSKASKPRFYDALWVGLSRLMRPLGRLMGG